MEKLKTFIYHRLAIIAERKGDYEEANRYYDSCIRACLKMVDGHNIIKNQAYYYLLGKLLYTGKGTVKNEKKAVEYLKEGAKMENFFYFGAIYSKKCQKLLIKINVDDNPVRISFAKSEGHVEVPKKTKSAQIFCLKDIKFDLFLQTVGPVKLFWGKFKDQPIKIAEYVYASQSNYIKIVNHLVNLLSLKNPYLEEIIGFAADPGVSEIVAIYKPIDWKFYTLEEIYEMEKNYDKQLAISSSRYDVKSTLVKSQETEEVFVTERSQSRYSFSQKLDICINISRAIQYLHSEKVIHGNLIPKYIYLTLDGEVKVTAYDYTNPGLFDSKTSFSRDAEDLKTDACRYLSPESLQRNKKVDFKSDIWSLGCVIYMIFYERHPFSELKADELVQGHKKKVQPDFKFHDETIPLEIQDLVKQCIKINSSQRCEISHIIHTLSNIKILKP